MKTMLLLFATCLVALFESHAGSTCNVDTNAVVIVGPDLIIPVPTGYRRNPRQEGFESESALFGGRECKTVAWFEGLSDTNAVDVVIVKADCLPSRRYSVGQFKSNCKKFAKEQRDASAVVDQVFGRTQSCWDEHLTTESFSMAQLQKIEFGECTGADSRLKKLRQAADLLQQTFGSETSGKPFARYVRKASVLVKGHIIAMEHRQVFRAPIDEAEVIHRKAVFFRDWEQELRRINPELSQMSPERKTVKDNSTQNFRHGAGRSAKETVDGVEWCFKIRNGTASVGMNTRGTAVPLSTTGAIVIPSDLGGCPVTEIGEFAFMKCNMLTSVIIPPSVTSINDCAFGGCKALKSVSIPSSVTKIGSLAFGGCDSLTTVTIPSAVTHIGFRPFDKCKALTEVRFLGPPPKSERAVRYMMEGLEKSVTIEYDAKFKKEWNPFLSNHKAVAFNSATSRQCCACEPLNKVTLSCVLLAVVAFAMVVVFFVKCARAANACHRRELEVNKEHEDHVDTDVQNANQPEGTSSEGKVIESVDNRDEVISAIEEDGVMAANEPKTEAQQAKTFRRAPSSVQTIAVVLVLEAAVWFVTAPSIGGVVSLIVRFLIARAAVRGSGGAKIVLYVFGLLGLLCGIFIMALSTSKGDDEFAKMFFYGGGFNFLMGVLLSTRSARKWTK